MATTTNSQHSGTLGTPDPRDDAALVLAIASQDKAAFALFFERYARKVRGFLIRIGAKEADADELAQEVMVTVWRKAHLFDPERAKATTWLFTIARNRWIDSLRRHARPEPDPNDPMFQPDAEPDGVTRLSGQERDAQVRSAIATLSVDQREVLIAAFFKGLSQSEIAEALGVPIGTVKSRTRLAFGKLRGVLSDSILDELKYD